MWKCEKCETLNDDGHSVCMICDFPKENFKSKQNDEVPVEENRDHSADSDSRMKGDSDNPINTKRGSKFLKRLEIFLAGFATLAAIVAVVLIVVVVLLII
ncbi:MAG: hypothetical protein LUC50_08650 [Ruminococcus sp.]|nr:hypothetical protein [Ruminococcus sp.]